MLDGSIKDNRRCAQICINKFKGIENVQMIISAAAEDNFWKSKITGFNSILNHGIQIIQNIRKGGGNSGSKFARLQKRIQYNLVE